MDELLEGHALFRQSYAVAERDFLQRLASEHQSPDAIFIGCADSRVVPELLTSSTPGELFVVRNVANMVPPYDNANVSVGAALEYALGPLHVRHVVVCGHYGCGGVGAMLNGAALESMPSLERWLGEPGRLLRAVTPEHLDAEARARAAVERHTLLQLGHLQTYPAVRALGDELALHAWVYDMRSGHIQVFDHQIGRFVDGLELIDRPG